MDLIKKQLDLCYNRNAHQQARQPPRNVFTGRKVRAPQSRMPANGRAPRGDGKWNRKHNRRWPWQHGTGKGEMVR